MERMEAIRKEIEELVSRITVSEIEKRIKQDKLEEENVEIISNDELVYQNAEINSVEVKEEVRIWKNESLLLVA